MAAPKPKTPKGQYEYNVRDQRDADAVSEIESGSVEKQEYKAQVCVTPVSVYLPNIEGDNNNVVVNVNVSISGNHPPVPPPPKKPKWERVIEQVVAWATRLKGLFF